MQLVSPTPEQWVQLSWIVGHLWLMVAVMLGTAFCYITAHGFIPSLVYTGEIDPEIGRRLRMPLYVLMAGGLAVFVGLAVSGILRALSVLPELYPRLAI